MMARATATAATTITITIDGTTIITTGMMRLVTTAIMG